MSKPFISIIIPTLNEEDFLPKLLDDFSKQDSSDFEVIVIDAGSTDKTEEKAKKYSGKYSFFFIPMEQNEDFTSKASPQKVSLQRNTGAKYARGMYFAFLDADVRIESDFISSIIKEMEKQKALLIFPYLLVQKKNAHEIAYTNMMHMITDMSIFLEKPISPSSSLIIQSDFFNFLGGYDINSAFFEDHEIAQRAYKCGVFGRLMKTIFVKPSFRRFEKDGEFSVYKRYLIATFHLMTKGKVEKELFSYEMGGQKYEKIETKQSFEKAFKEKIEKIKKQFSDIMKEEE